MEFFISGPLHLTSIQGLCSILWHAPQQIQKSLLEFALIDNVVGSLGKKAGD